MIEERTYHPSELKRGKCRDCGKMSNKILIGDGRCVDCIESEIFYEQSMQLMDKEGGDWL